MYTERKHCINKFLKSIFSDARVINGQGIVTFDQRSNAEKAIRQMDSQPILSSNVHCCMTPDNTDAISITSSRRSSADSDHGMFFSDPLAVNRSTNAYS